jgi:hypothetical protein
VKELLYDALIDPSIDSDAVVVDTTLLYFVVLTIKV